MSRGERMRGRRIPRGLGWVAGLTALVLVLAVGCGDDDKPNNPGDGGLLFDFTLVDANPYSASYTQQVSPLWYQGRPVVIYVALAS